MYMSIQEKDEKQRTRLFHPLLFVSDLNLEMIGLTVACNVCWSLTIGIAPQTFSDHETGLARKCHTFK